MGFGCSMKNDSHIPQDTALSGSAERVRFFRAVVEMTKAAIGGRVDGVAFGPLKIPACLAGQTVPDAEQKVAYA